MDEIEERQRDEELGYHETLQHPRPLAEGPCGPEEHKGDRHREVMGNDIARHGNNRPHPQEHGLHMPGDVMRSLPERLSR